MADWKLRPFPIPQKTQSKEPRRNVRDPRLKSYKPPSPTRYTGTPVLIPLDYDPKLNPKPPTRTSRPFQVNNNGQTAHFKTNTTRILRLFQSAPNMRRIMAEMSAIHAPNPPSKKPPMRASKPLLGAIIKGVRPPKGCLLYTSPSPRDRQKSRMPSSA